MGVRKPERLPASRYYRKATNTVDSTEKQGGYMKSRVLPYTIAMAVIAGVAFLTALAAQDDSAKSVSRPATRSLPSARWAGLLAVTLGLLLSFFLATGFSQRWTEEIVRPSH